MKKNEWAKIIINQIQKETPKYVIITEWRYIAEYDIIKKAFPNEKIITISLPKKETYIEDLQEFQFNYIIKEEISKRCIDIVTFLLHK